jgi:hypothetical protein
MELVRRLGGWNDAVSYVADNDLWLRMAFHTKVLKVDRHWSCTREHPGQRDKQAARIARDWAAMIDSSPDVAGAPRELRRAAEAGKHLAAIRYCASRSHLEMTYRAYRALLACPSCFRHKGFPCWLLLPGYNRARHCLSRLKRCLVSAGPAALRKDRQVPEGEPRP